MSTTTANVKRKAKAADRGRWKIGVYFVDHKSPSGAAYYFHSNKSQDNSGISANRLKKLVANTWKGKVNWAGLYEDNVLKAEYRDGEWTHNN